MALCEISARPLLSALRYHLSTLSPWGKEMMIRKAAMLIASFAFGVLTTLVLQDAVTPHAVAQTMPLKEKPPPVPPPGKPTPPPPPAPLDIQPLKLQPWQQYVNDWLALLRREDQKQDAQLSQLNAQVSSLNSQVSNLTSALNKLQTRFENHYHTFTETGSRQTPLAIIGILDCPGQIGANCVAASSYKGVVSVPVTVPDDCPSCPSYWTTAVPTTVPLNGPPPPPPPVNDIKRRPPGHTMRIVPTPSSGPH